MHLRQAATMDGKVLGEDVDGTAVDAATACDDAIT